MTGIDVAIVGAGPAGAWAARCLARTGARVALFDPSHPREKPCGGGVTGRALAIVGDALAAALRPVIVVRARFQAAIQSGAPPPTADLPLPAHGLSPETGLGVVSRAAFDHALLLAAVDAGATHASERVVDVTTGPAGVEVRTGRARYRAERLFGADGVNSLTRRRLARPFARAQLSIATGFFAHGVTSSAIDIACVGNPPGYIWSFPRADHLAIGICAQADAGHTATALRERTRSWLRRVGIGTGARLTPYAWPIPSLAPGDFDRERPAGPRWMLLGDAAGLVDPLTREGIFFALLSGGWAAEALASGAGRAEVIYAERLRDAVYPELRLAAAVRDRFFHPAFTGLMVEALGASPRIRAVMADLIVGRQPYHGLRRRLLATLELGWAWRLARLTLSARLRTLGALPRTLPA